MNINELSEEELDKYDSALVAISENIRIIHKMKMQRQFLTDLYDLVPEELEQLIQQAERMYIGKPQLRKGAR